MAHPPNLIDVPKQGSSRRWVRLRKTLLILCRRFDPGTEEQNLDYTGGNPCWEAPPILYIWYSIQTQSSLILGEQNATFVQKHPRYDNTNTKLHGQYGGPFSFLARTQIQPMMCSPQANSFQIIEVRNDYNTFAYDAVIVSEPSLSDGGK
jgi:hypothetical protein